MIAISAIGVEVGGANVEGWAVKELDRFGGEFWLGYYCLCHLGQVEFCECCIFFFCETEDPYEDQIR